MTIQAVRKSNYGEYSSDNYGAHSMRLEVGCLTFYFSYDTVVAFRSPETGRVVRENSWGATTGKHLNWIDDGDKKARLASVDFDKALAKVLKKYKLEI